MGLLGHTPSFELGTKEQIERATATVAAIQAEDGEAAAATFGIGVHNGFAHRLYGPAADAISDALQQTQGGRACLSLGLQVYLRKGAEGRAEDAEQQIRDLRRKRRFPGTAFHLAAPVHPVQLEGNQVLVRTAHGALKILDLDELEFIPDRRRSYVRPK